MHSIVNKTSLKVLWVHLILFIIFFVSVPSVKAEENIMQQFSKNFASQKINLENETDYTTIILKNKKATIEGTGATISNNKISLTEGKTYYIKGKLENGYIEIDSTEDIVLIFDEVHISCADNAIIQVKNNIKTYIYLTDGTENKLERGNNGQASNNFSKECIYSNGKIIFSGTGKLLIQSDYYDGIKTGSDLLIFDCSLEINTPEAIKTGNTVYMENCTMTIKSRNDGITSIGNLFINGSTVTFNNCSENINVSEKSRKAIKSKGSIYCSDSKINITSIDHAIHAAGNITIYSGEYQLSSEYGKGIAASEDVFIYDGVISILKSYEGIEGKKNVVINGGSLNIVSSDDAINVGDDGEGIIINNGEINIDCQCDGIDTCGKLEINGGNIIIAGPPDVSDSPLDAGQGIFINGGNIITYSGLGEIQYPKYESRQNSVILNCPEIIKEGTNFKVIDKSGQEILNFVAKKDFQCVIMSSIAFTQGSSFISQLNNQDYKDITINRTCNVFGYPGFLSLMLNYKSIWLLGRTILGILFCIIPNILFLSSEKIIPWKGKFKFAYGLCTVSIIIYTYIILNICRIICMRNNYFLIFFGPALLVVLIAATLWKMGAKQKEKWKTNILLLGSQIIFIGGVITSSIMYFKY